MLSIHTYSLNFNNENNLLIHYVYLLIPNGITEEITGYVTFSFPVEIALEGVNEGYGYFNITVSSLTNKSSKTVCEMNVKQICLLISHKTVLKHTVTCFMTQTWFSPFKIYKNVCQLYYIIFSLQMFTSQILFFAL